MLKSGFILVPLYMFPFPGAWDPLLHAAQKHPEINFHAIINPDSGPGQASCPGPEYSTALANLIAYPNIQTLGYVHTANRWDCGSNSNEICTCTQPLSAVRANITRYARWPRAGCSFPSGKGVSLHVDGIFIDEAPADSAGGCWAYMREAANHARQQMSRGANTVFFNTGVRTDEAYWRIADYINVFENTAEVFDAHGLAAFTGTGRYSSRSTVIINGYEGSVASLQGSVDVLLKRGYKSIAGLYISNHNQLYDRFPEFWEGLVEAVAGFV
ncbi:hypothetical protein D0863_04375 [Hortaea werneckii]|uniref:Spherulation-specific family 4 n=1 Tax=Hortaea werneckii TaxID=91943 RepID=A0A3M7E8A8_HORWE|nr:hypothetical protein D0863_04375 [Hortaea werneckii]